MANRGDIVDYTFTTWADQFDANGNWTGRAKVYLTRPATVLEAKDGDVCDLEVSAYARELPEGTSEYIVPAVPRGAAAPDTRKGARLDPTAPAGEPGAQPLKGTWSPR